MYHRYMDIFIVDVGQRIVYTYVCAGRSEMLGEDDGSDDSLDSNIPVSQYTTYLRRACRMREMRKVGSMSPKCLAT